MSGFFDRIKDAFGSKKPPKFKIYESQEIKMVALRTRVILGENMEQLLKAISAEDQKFKFVGNNPADTYAVLQAIGEKVIEAESIKIFVEMMRKVEANCANIAKTNGDIALLRTEVQWFQTVLWYRKAKEVRNLDDLYNFCFEFFKGVDITRQMDADCEVFTLYPILKYLSKNGVLPLAEVLFYLQPYVSCNISKPALEAIFQVNRQDIANRSSLADPDARSRIKEPSRVFPSSAIYSVGETSPPKKPSNPYEIQEPFQPQSNQGSTSTLRNPAYNTSNIPNPNMNNNYNNSYYNYNSNMGNAQNNSSNYFAPSQQQSQYGYSGNTINLEKNQPPQQSNQFFNPNGFAPQGSNYSPYPQQQIDHNPFSSSTKFQGSTFNQPQNPNYRPPEVEEKKQPAEEKKVPVLPPPVEPTKKSFFNSLMRTNSNQGNQSNQQTTNDSTCFILPDRVREDVEFVYNEASQSYIPLNRDSYDHFNNPNNYAKDYELKQKRKREAEELERAEQQRKAEEERKAEQQRKAEQARKAEQERRAEEQRRAEEAAIKLQLQRRVREEEVRRLKEEEERRKQEQLQKEKEKAEELIRLKKQEEQRLKAQKERQEQEEEERREREEEQRERERELRMSEREREEERELNVFVDNEREGFDRGLSGRFSSNMGFKANFQEYQAQEFGYGSHNMNSSMLRFKEERLPPAEPQLVNHEQRDEEQSLQFVESGHASDNGQTFKLFYYKKAQK